MMKSFNFLLCICIFAPAGSTTGLLENFTETSLSDTVEIEMFFSLLKMDFHRTKTEMRKERLFKRYSQRNRAIKRFFQICDSDRNGAVDFSEYDDCVEKYEKTLAEKFTLIGSTHIDFLTEEVKFGIQNFFDLNNDRQFTESELVESYYYITRKFIEIYLQYTSANRESWLLNEIQSVFESFPVSDENYAEISRNIAFYRFVPMTFKVVLNSNSRSRLREMISRIDPNDDGALDTVELTAFFFKITDNFSKIMKKKMI